MTKLYQQAMTPEVFSWNAASNNQGLIAGKLSYILNSLSAWRTAQEVNPEVSKDVFFTKALKGPKAALAAQHVLYNWILPKHSGNVDAAKEFLLHYTANFASASYASKMYDFPAWPKLAPDLPAWLKKDPFGATPADKLSFLGSTEEAAKWSAEHRTSRTVQPGDRRGSRDVPHPEHVRQGGPRRTDPRADRGADPRPRWRRCSPSGAPAAWSVAEPRTDELPGTARNCSGRGVSALA